MDHTAEIQRLTLIAESKKKFLDGLSDKLRALCKDLPVNKTIVVTAKKINDMSREMRISIKDYSDYMSTEPVNEDLKVKAVADFAIAANNLLSRTIDEYFPR